MIFKTFLTVALSNLLVSFFFATILIGQHGFTTAVGNFSYYLASNAQSILLGNLVHVNYPPVPVILSQAIVFSPEIERTLVALPDLQRELLCGDLEDKDEIILNLLSIGILAEKSGEAMADYIARTASKIDHVLFSLRHALPVSRPAPAQLHRLWGLFSWSEHLITEFSLFLYNQFSLASPFQEVAHGLEMYTTLMHEMGPHNDIVYHIIIMLEVHIESLLDILSRDKEMSSGSPSPNLVKSNLVEVLEPLRKPIHTLLNVMNSLQATMNVLKSLGDLPNATVSTQQDIRAIARGCAFARGQLLLLHAL